MRQRQPAGELDSKRPKNALLRVALAGHLGSNPRPRSDLYQIESRFCIALARRLWGACVAHSASILRQLFVANPAGIELLRGNTNPGA